MNKILLILIIIFPIILLSLPLNESFTGITFPPLGWTVVNRDSGTEAWRRDTTIYKTQPASTASRFETSVRSDDWLITPALIIGQDDSLCFWYRKRFGNYDTLRVKVTTTTNHPDSFNLLLLEKRITAETFIREAIFLGGFANDTIFIAFIHNGPSNQGTLYLDDITGPEMVEIRDVGVDTILSPVNTFYIRPVGTGFQPQAKITNYSNEIQRNIPIICSIVGQGSFLYFQNIKSVDSLLIDSSIVVTFDSFAPNFTELCTVKVTSFLAGDTNPTNNHKSSTTQIICGQYTGGPDSQYYYWIDSDTTGGPIYNWTDITLTGNQLPIGSAGISWQVPIGFNFSFYGKSESLFYYSTAGFISFDGLSSSYTNNQPIPNSDLPNKMIAPFWDRLWVISARHQLFDTAPNRYRVIQWNAICNPSGGDFKDTAIFQAILHENGDITFQYNKCGNRFNLGQGQSASVGIENDLGSVGLQYLYNGMSQGNLLSGGRAIRFYRSCHDVMLDTILTSQVGISDTVSPQVIVKNIGSSTESFLTVFNIFQAQQLIYADSVPVNNLAPFQCCSLGFSQWFANQYGTYTVKAWTTLINDINPNNDTCEQQLEVSITAPILLSPINGYATNIHTIAFDWSDVFNATRYNFQILNNVDTIVTNSDFGPLHFTDGIYYWRVRAGNDERWGFWSETFYLTIDTTPPNAPILISPVQSCTLSSPYPFFSWHIVDNAVLYNIVVSTISGTYLNQTITDTSYQTTQPFTSGTYFWKVRCRDQALNWSYFSPIQIFYIQSVITGGWQQKPGVLELFSNKPIKDGGCLTGLNNKLYALKGNNTQDFYDYDINTNQWNIRNFIPYYSTDTNIVRRKVKSGGSLVSANNYIYALKGNNTKEFWRYDPLIDDWQIKKPVPSARKIGGGSGIAYYNGYIYCLVGASYSYEFFKYDIANDTWIKLSPAPAGKDNKRFRTGSCIVYGGNDKIYTLKGNARYNEFYCYNINSNTWQTKESLPFYHPFIRKKTKIKSGGAMCFNGLDIIYAIKGGGQNEFWQYNTLTNQWFPLETIPRVNKKSVVKSGASLAFADNRVWLLKGNNTWEMWSYATQNTKSDIQGINNISLKTNLCTRKIIHLQKNNRKTMDNILIDIQNNLPIKIFDIQGKLVQSVNDKSFLSLDYLPVGVYIIVAERIYH